MVIVIVIVMGLGYYGDLARDSMPSSTVRTVSIVTNFSGASPERMELLISKPIEEVAQEIPQVKYISSTSRTGLSVVNVSLTNDVPAKDLQAIWDRLRRKIEGIEGQLPSGIKGPTVKDESVGEVFGIFVGLQSDGFSYAEMERYAEDLRDRLIALRDASKVEIGGIIEERIYVEYNEAELANLGISSTQLQNTISTTNIILPAGEVNLGEERIILEPSGNLESLADIKDIQVPIGNGESIALEEIAQVRRDYVSPRDEIVKINGEYAMALYISLKEDANIIQMGEDVDLLLSEYNPQLPLGLSTVRIASQDYEVDKSINNFVSNVVQSVLIVLFVVLVFLGFRAGIVVASIIPVTIIATFLLMGLFGTGLNQVTLAALIMALGLLVDNGIVMVESIMERLEDGESHFEAAFNSCKEFMVPLLISSLTTCAAFLSFYLAESALGEIMGNLFIVITMALLSSWVTAFTVIPLLANLLLRVKKKGSSHRKSLFDFLVDPYNRFLRWSLKRPFIIIGAIIILFMVSLFGFTKVPFVFMPDSDRALVTLEMNLPLGTRIETTTAEASKIEQFIEEELLADTEQTEGVSNWSTYIGVGPNSFDQGYRPGEANDAYAFFILNTSNFEANQMVMQKLDSFCILNIPDAQITVKQLGSGGGAAVPVQIRLSGTDNATLTQIASQIKRQLYTIPGTKNIDDNWGPKIKKFFIRISPNKLRYTGLTNQDVAQSLSTFLSGRKVGEFREEDNTIPISMQVEGSENLSYYDLESMTVFAQNTGVNIPLAQIATIEPEWQYSKILRRDLKRTITVECALKAGYTASDITDILLPWLEEESVNWPMGYSFEPGGESESSSEAMSAVIAKLPLSLLLMTLLLIIQFNSVRKTTIILATIPLGLIGVVGGLLITGSNFSFTAFLGIISLAGIIINDGIVLIDKINSEITIFGLEPHDAILKSANNRLNPILLTTFTTSFGMIPLWFGGGAMWQPMAVSIIFGLLFATLILLVFVPVIYKLLFRIKG